MIDLLFSWIRFYLFANSFLKLRRFRPCCLESHLALYVHREFDAASFRSSNVFIVRTHRQYFTYNNFPNRVSHWTNVHLSDVNATFNCTQHLVGFQIIVKTFVFPKRGSLETSIILSTGMTFALLLEELLVRSVYANHLLPLHQKQRWWSEWINCSDLTM